VRVLDFGNSFNFHVISRALRRYTVDLHTPTLERIHVARAFTCYQVLSCWPKLLAASVQRFVSSFYPLFMMKM
jgi:hypothetical protein